MERRIKIEGMKCKSCKSIIEDGVSGMLGVKDIHVNIEEKNAIIELEQDRIDDILETINKLGFYAWVE
jgi:Cu+-exporting ATPase